MGRLELKIEEQLKDLSPVELKEVLDFVNFLKNKTKEDSDYDYIMKNEELKKSIIEGMKTPLNECSDKLDD